MAAGLYEICKFSKIVQTKRYLAEHNTEITKETTRAGESLFYSAYADEEKAAKKRRIVYERYNLLYFRGLKKGGGGAPCAALLGGRVKAFDCAQ